jgi:DNA-binding response OmpR family regulator
MKTVLIADDDPVMVKLMEYNLRRAGFGVLVCHEGLSVFARVKAERPDLIMLDVMLPGRSGLELLRDIKADSELANLPVVVVTSQGKNSTQDELMAAGALNVFTKPFSPTMLMARVRQVLGEPATVPEEKPFLS